MSTDGEILAFTSYPELTFTICCTHKFVVNSSFFALMFLFKYPENIVLYKFYMKSLFSFEYIANI